MEETSSIIKYRPLEGCEDQFEEELKKLTEIIRKQVALPIKRLLSLPS